MADPKQAFRSFTGESAPSTPGPFTNTPAFHFPATPYDATPHRTTSTTSDASTPFADHHSAAYGRTPGPGFSFPANVPSTPSLAAYGVGATPLPAQFRPSSSSALNSNGHAPPFTPFALGLSSDDQSAPPSPLAFPSPTQSPVVSPVVSPRSESPSTSSSLSVLPDAPFVPHASLHFPDSPSPLPSLSSSLLASPQLSPSPSPSPSPLRVSKSSAWASPSPSSSSFMLPAPYTPIAPPGEKRQASNKRLIKSFTAMDDDGEATLRTPSAQLSPGLSAFSFDEGASIDEGNKSLPDDAIVVAGLIADIRHLAAKDLQLQSSIGELIKKKSQHPATRLEMEVAQRKQTLMELEQAAKQQNEEMQQMDLELRQTETGLAELKRERAQRLDEARQAAAARATMTEKSQAGPGWGVLGKCVALTLFLLLLAEVLLRYYDACADSLHAYLLELNHPHHHVYDRPT